MNDYNEQEKCTDDTCSACELKNELIAEFGEMVKSNVHWENALRHILDVAFAKDDEMLADLVDETYTEGFHHGILFGVEQSQKALDNVHEYMVNKIAEDEAKEFGNVNEPEDEIEFQDEDDNDDEIQKIIKKNS